ncbi:MAG: class I SAM-dependent methyltransferase [Bacteroidota bacterium]
MSDTAQHWESIYQKYDPTEVSWYQEQPTLSLELIRQTNVDAHAPMIDVGGGASKLVDLLLEAGYTNLSVLDISKQAIRYAQQRLEDHADQVRWHITDLLNFHPPQTYRVWHDRAVFHFLTEQTDRQQYIQVLKQGLKPGGHLILGAFAVGGPTKCSGLSIRQYNTEILLETLGDDFHINQQQADVHITPRGVQQEFNFYRLQYNP